MIRELFQETVREIALNVTQSKIDSVRKKNITKSGCRSYDNCYIGIEGTLGEPMEETWKIAEKNLDKKIPYPYEPEKNKKRIRDLRNAELTSEVFMVKSEELLVELRKRFPEFIFSNKIKLVETELTLSNDAGLDYRNIDRYAEVGLIVKHVDSVNIFDTFVGYAGRTFNEEQILSETKEQYEAFKRTVEIPKEEKIQVIVGFQEIAKKFYESLNGEALGRNVSIFKDKIGTKAFHEDFTVYEDRSEENYGVPFFDFEGSTLSGDKMALIDHGNILHGYTDKKNAAEFKMPNTAAAGGSYDDVPALGGGHMSVKPSDKKLTQLLGGRDSILMVMMSGGDCTNEGNFASPVQMAYLIKDGKMVGRLPEFAVSGSIYDMFGKDYIGQSADKPYFSDHVIVMNMQITR